MKKIVGIATYPPRLSCLLDTIDSLYDQVDEIQLCLNEYHDVPTALSNRPKVKCTIPEHNLYDSGKFLNVSKINGYYFACDDDLIYPQNYVSNTIANLLKYNNKAAVGYHGRVQHSGRKSNSYYCDVKDFYPCLKRVNTNQRVHVLGTGVIGFHTDVINISIDNFKTGNMADIWFGITAHHQRLPLVVLKHEQGWIKHTSKINTAEETIYSRYHNNDTLQTDLINSVAWQPLCSQQAMSIPMFLATPTPMQKSYS